MSEKDERQHATRSRLYVAVSTHAYFMRNHVFLSGFCDQLMPFLLRHDSSWSMTSRAALSLAKLLPSVCSMMQSTANLVFSETHCYVFIPRKIFSKGRHKTYMPRRLHVVTPSKRHIVSLPCFPIHTPPHAACTDDGTGRSNAEYPRWLMHRRRSRS